MAGKMYNIDNEVLIKAYIQNLVSDTRQIKLAAKNE